MTAIHSGMPPRTSTTRRASWPPTGRCTISSSRRSLRTCRSKPTEGPGLLVGPPHPDLSGPRDRHLRHAERGQLDRRAGVEIVTHPVHALPQIVEVRRDGYLAD